MTSLSRWLLLGGFALLGCGKQKNPCTVEDSATGALIKCPDGTEQEIKDGTAASADASPVLPGPVGPAGMKGEKGEPGDKGDSGANGADGTDGVNGTNGANGTVGPMGPMGPKGESADDLDAFVYDANGTKVGRFLGSAGVRSYYVKLLDEVFALIGTGGDIQPTGIARCYYTSSNCTGTCYGLVSSANEVNDYVTVNGRNIGGAGIDNVAMRIASKATQTPATFVSHYQGSSCIVEGGNPLVTSTYFTFANYNPSPALYVPPLDVKLQ